MGGVFFAEGKSVALENLERKYGYNKEIVYIDDDTEPLHFAKDLGIHTILYKTGNIKELIETLQNLGVLV